MGDPYAMTCELVFADEFCAFVSMLCIKACCQQALTLVVKLEKYVPLVAQWSRLREGLGRLGTLTYSGY